MHRLYRFLPILLLPIALGSTACNGSFCKGLASAGKITSAVGQGFGAFEQPACEFSTTAGLDEGDPRSVRAHELGRACDHAQAEHNPLGFAKALQDLGAVLQDVGVLVAPAPAKGPLSLRDDDDGAGGAPPEPPPDDVSPTLPLPPPSPMAMASLKGTAP